MELFLYGIKLGEIIYLKGEHNRKIMMYIKI